MMEEAKQPVAIVTGGERGIGRGIVRELVSNGYAVGVLGVEDEAGRSLSAETGLSGKVFYRHGDVGSEKEVREGIDAVVARFGRLDALVANAGLAEAGGQAVETLSLEAWDRVLRTNLTGMFLCAKHGFPHLRRSEGAMVLIASTRALQSEADTVAYSASKGGAVALAHSLAVSGGPEIRVNAVSPGWIHHGDPGELRDVDHAQHPAGRVGCHADIAGMVAYLLSPKAAFITGQNFVVDGGMTTKMIYEH
jgi:NAD(P)-dependent dehydrogenase (short-subunit alcohol dehydrogenase family)